MIAADLPPVACLEIQIADHVAAFKTADLVELGQLRGRIVSFTCASQEPGAWVLFDVPGSVRGATMLRLVSLAELVRIK